MASSMATLTTVCILLHAFFVILVTCNPAGSFDLVSKGVFVHPSNGMQFELMSDNHTSDQAIEFERFISAYQKVQLTERWKSKEKYWENCQGWEVPNQPTALGGCFADEYKLFEGYTDIDKHQSNVRHPHRHTSIRHSIDVLLRAQLLVHFTGHDTPSRCTLMLHTYPVCVSVSRLISAPVKHGLVRSFGDYVIQCMTVFSRYTKIITHTTDGAEINVCVTARPVLCTADICFPKEGSTPMSVWNEENLRDDP